MVRSFGASDDLSADRGYNARLPWMSMSPSAWVLAGILLLVSVVDHSGLERGWFHVFLQPSDTLQFAIQVHEHSPTTWTPHPHHSIPKKSLARAAHGGMVEKVETTR